MEKNILYKYLSGQTTAQEDKELLDWLNASEENRRVFFELKTIWNMRRGLGGADSWTIRRSLDLLNQRIDAFTDEPHTRNEEPSFGSDQPDTRQDAASSGGLGRNESRPQVGGKRSLLFFWSSVAAVLIGLGGIFFHYKGYKSHPVASPLHTLTNRVADSILQVHLTDGSTVWLNTHASLTYPENFTGRQREVRLEGNAFFEVAADSLHPFIVATDLYQVEVVGTSFSINTDDSDDMAETILLEGAVRLARLDGGSLVDLRPGQQALYSKSRQTVEVNEIDARQHTLWRFGLISLSDVSLQEILHYLEELYHIRIQMDISKWKDHRYSFSFKQSGSPEDALRHLFYLTGAQATILP